MNYYLHEQEEGLGEREENNNSTLNFQGNQWDRGEIRLQKVAYI